MTPSLVRVARSHGYFATSVRDLGMLGASDPDVFREALRLGSTLVTANPRDFEVLARRSPGHHGLVVFRCSLPREVSIRLFEGWLAGHVTLSAPTGMRVRLEPGMPPLVESLT